MKIIMDVDLLENVTFRFISDNGEVFHIFGKYASDMAPRPGCHLLDGQDKLLKEWLDKIIKSDYHNNQT